MLYKKKIYSEIYCAPLRCLQRGKVLKSVFSEIRVRTWIQVVSHQKTGLWLADLSGLPIRGLFFDGKTLELMPWLGSQKKLTLVVYKKQTYII